MMTACYERWADTWIRSIKKNLPKAEIFIYTINYSAANQEPGVTYIEYKADAPIWRYERKCVTYLKGELICDALTGYDGLVVWLDITAIMRAYPTEFVDGDWDVVLIKRNRPEKKLQHCAEMQGWRNMMAAEHYKKECRINKKEWFADQAALADIPSKYRIKKIKHETGEYCNLEYGEDAIEWSARNHKDPPANGLVCEEDILYAIERFKNDLADLPRILVYIDDTDWCYFTSAHEIIKRLRHKYKFETVTKISDRRKIITGKYDLIWSRAGAHRIKPLLDYKPKAANIVVGSITTGGSELARRIELHDKHGQEFVGVITQNSESIKALKKLKKSTQAYLIPNGVDLIKFRPISYPAEFKAGFSGRKDIPSRDKLKGYSDYIVPACKRLDVPLLEAGSGISKKDYNSMADFYNSISVLIQPSTGEGCSNAIMEAMACGRVCLITEVGYHGEVCNGDIKSPNASVVFVKRDPADIAAKIEILKNNPKIYKRIAANARLFAEAHSWDHIAIQFDNLFNHFINVIKNDRRIANENNANENSNRRGTLSKLRADIFI